MSDNEHFTTHHLDTCGLSCPEPVMLLHSAVRDAKAGDHIVILATDPASERDISKFCAYLGHTLVSIERRESIFTFEIIKGAV